MHGASETCMLWFPEIANKIIAKSGLVRQILQEWEWQQRESDSLVGTESEVQRLSITGKSLKQLTVEYIGPDALAGPVKGYKGTNNICG